MASGRQRRSPKALYRTGLPDYLATSHTAVPRFMAALSDLHLRLPCRWHGRDQLTHRAAITFDPLLAAVDQAEILRIGHPFVACAELRLAVDYVASAAGFVAPAGYVGADGADPSAPVAALGYQTADCRYECLGCPFSAPVTW